MIVRSGSLIVRFENFSSWFLLLMWFWVEQVLKLTNLTNWLNNPKSCAGGENSTKNWKSKHSFIWWDFHSGSWRNMSHSILRFLSWDLGEKCDFAIRSEKVCLMESDERKRLKLMEIMLCVWETRKKFKFSYLEKFFLTQQLRWNGKSWKLELNPLFSCKSQVKLSLLASSLSLQS